MIISYIKKNYYYLISLSIFLFLIFSKLIFKPFKLITLVSFFLILLCILLQNLSKTLKIQVNLFLIITYLLVFFLDFNIEQMIFKSCVRGSCYQDYLNKNKEKDLKMNILGKNFINNSYLVPVSTYPNEKILGSNENGYWPIFKSDKFGFNNNNKIYNNTNISTLIIGDSFAQNITVNYEKSIQGIINSYGLPTLSLGIGGNGPLLNLATFKEYSKHLNYKNLIYFFTETNDLFYDITVEKKNIILKQYLEDNFSQNLINRKGEILKLLNNKSNEIHENYKLSKKFNLWKILRSLTLPNTRFVLNIINSGEEDDYNKFFMPENINFEKSDLKIDSNEANLKIQNEVLKQINKFSKLSNMYLIYIPNKNNFIKNKKSNLFTIMKIISEQNNFKFIDLYEQIEINKRKNIFPKNYQHFNEEGQLLMANVIFDNLNN